MRVCRRTIMEQLPWLVPLVPLELPGLTCGDDADDTIPCVCTELRQRIYAVHDEVGVFDDCLLPARVDGCSFSVYRDHVFGLHVAFCGGAGLCVLRRFKASVVDSKLLSIV